MQYLKIKRGYRFQITGKPSHQLLNLPDPDEVALVPDKITHVRPRLRVAQGDRVAIGSLIFEDKRNPAFRFLSPAAGTIQRIEFGPRRIIQAIVIKRDTTNEAHSGFPVISADKLAKMERNQLIDLILDGGLWWIFRALPFRDLPDPQAAPPLIIVHFHGKEPFLPQAQAYLADRSDWLRFGLQAVHKLAEGRIVVFADHRDNGLTPQCQEWLTHTIEGHYPADDPGTVLFHIKKGVAENSAWYVSAQDLLLLAQLLAQGRYPIERIVAVAGSAAPVRRHFRTRIGVPLAHLVAPSTVAHDVRWVTGGLMHGYAASANGFMGLRETSLCLLPEGDQAEFMALYKPGYDKPSYSRTFLSYFNPGQMIYNCNLHGDRRACIACLHCADICPVHILPHMTYKAILAEEVEEYLSHGLLDCVECGLCSYVCPSKIELSQTFRETKAAYAKEQAGLQ